MEDLEKFKKKRPEDFSAQADELERLLTQSGHDSVMDRSRPLLHKLEIVKHYGVVSPKPRNLYLYEI